MMKAELKYNSLLGVLIPLFLVSSVDGQRKTDSLNACWLITHTVSHQFIIKNARKIVSDGDENCVIAFLDKLTDSSFGRNYTIYFETLSAVQQVSDGFISEYFNEIGARLFHKNFDKLFNFMYKKQSRFDSPIEKVIIEAVGDEIADSENHHNEKLKINEFLGLKKKQMTLSPDQSAYLDRLKDEIFKFSESQQFINSELPICSGLE